MFRCPRILPVLFTLSFLPSLPGFAEPFTPEVLRGEVRVDLEPVFARYVDEPYPPDTETTRRRALEESALFYGAMIYGWSFNYDIGERARGIVEELELDPLGELRFGDPGLQATDVRVEDGCFYLLTDYRLTEVQQRRMRMWNAGTTRAIQATGYGPLGGPVEGADWITIKKTALEDAARAGLRAILRGSERNRPKEARGFISLAAFPRYWMEAGQWAVSARFRVTLTELVPFGAY
ncbi:MAG: hypothetical protein LBQ38_01895 [Spirochaetaceae bacterium]|jgi:hypothetical protein|nr:hypothetical protein [Spirochaetaceae bacterium]